MKLKLTQIVGFLLLAAFLLVSVGNVPVYAWCFGEKVHLEIEETKTSRCVDHQKEPKEAVKYDTPSLQGSGDKHCDTCFHLSAQQNEATFSKRLKKLLHIPADAISPDVLPQVFVQRVELVAGLLASQPPPRISQTILAHRTVVLLN